MFFKFKRKTLLILFSIFLLGLFLRFYQLGSFPIGFFRDEAFLGYNAFSILKTGHDMTGNLLPLHLKSFLYSPAGYSYFSIPFILIFGLSEFSVRFASALFGSLTILSTFFLAKALFIDHKKKDFIALTSALFLAISPWHINLSRASTENVIVVFFISIGVWLFILWAKNNKIFFFLASYFCFSLTLMIYQASRSFLPLFLPLLFFVFLGKRYKKWILSIFAFLIIIIIPILIILKSPQLSTRINAVSIFNDPGTQLILNEQLREDGVAKIDPHFARIFHNKILTYSQVFLNNYFSYFSYDFLFGQNYLPIRYQIPAMGLLYPIDIVFLISGIWFLVKKQSKNALFLLGWLMLSVVGSALTFNDAPNIQRTLLMFPALSIVASCGLLELEEFLQTIKFLRDRKIILTINFAIVIMFVYCLAYYMQAYYLHAPLHHPWFRQVGYKELVADISSIQSDYKKVTITQAEGTPTIFFLFYGHYNSAIFQKLEVLAKPQLENNLLDQVPFAKYDFARLDCPLEEEPIFNVNTGKIKYVLNGDSSVLYVNDGACKIPRKHAKVIKIIRRPDRTPAFIILSYVP